MIFLQKQTQNTSNTGAATNQDNLSALETVMDKLNSWWEAFIRNLPNLAVALLVLILSFVVSRVVFNFSYKIFKKRIKQKSIARLVSRIISVFVVLIGLFLALGALNLGEALTGLLTGAGISGLVIGLALQGTLSNTVSGVVLAFRNTIRVGDWIETNDYTGEVIEIKLNYFVMRTIDNNTVVIPNKQVLESPFKNYSLTKQMRIILECGVGYESDLEQVERITRETINSNFDQKSMGKEVEFFYTEFGGSSINFICRFWIDGERGIDRLINKSKAIIAIKKAYDKNDINIPFPIRTLQFDNKLNIENESSKTDETKKE